MSRVWNTNPHATSIDAAGASQRRRQQEREPTMRDKHRPAPQAFVQAAAEHRLAHVIDETDPSGQHVAWCPGCAQERAEAEFDGREPAADARCVNCGCDIHDGACPEGCPQEQPQASQPQSLTDGTAGCTQAAIGARPGVTFVILTIDKAPAADPWTILRTVNDALLNAGERLNRAGVNAVHMTNGEKSLQFDLY